MLLQSLILASSAHGDNGLALDLLAILSAAGLVALLARKINLATIPCYLIAGALIGPHALGAAGAGEGGAGSITSLATVLLMFTIGLHLDIGGLRGGLMSIALVTVVGSVMCVLIGWPVGLLFGLSSPGSIAVAMAITISSTAVVLRIMEQRRELHLVQGRTTLGILVLQDMVALLLMAMIPLLALWAKVGAGVASSGPPPSPLKMLSQASVSIGGISAMVVIGRLALPRLLKAASFSQEVLLVVSAAVALASAVAAAALKFSPELGAFLAGFLLASTPFRYQLAGMLAPLRDLFLAIFFTAIGLDLSPSTLLNGWWIVLLSVVATVTVKSFVLGTTAWAAGASGPVAVYLGLALAQGGEFSLVLLAQAKSAGILSENQSALAIACVVLSLIVTPNLMDLARKLMTRAHEIPPAWWIRKSMLRDATAHAHLEAEPGDTTDGTAGPALGSLAIVAGFGPVGRAVADNLEKRGVIVTVIELNPRTVEKQHALGRSIVYGDAPNPEVLERAGLHRAEAIVLTMPDEEAVLRACRVVRQNKPDVFIAARLNVLSKALQAMQLGADHTVVEELATAEAMAKQVILKLEQRAAGEDGGPKLYQLQG